jgi:hypothetical protein
MINTTTAKRLLLFALIVFGAIVLISTLQAKEQIGEIQNANLMGRI